MNNIIINGEPVIARGGETILEAARKGQRIEARTDQFAAPTSVMLYADLMIRAVEKGAKGTFHLVSQGSTSRYGFASKVLEYAGYDPEKVLIPAEDARTAENVVLESMMLSMAGVELPAWEDDLRSYMEEAAHVTPDHPVYLDA